MDMVSVKIPFSGFYHSSHDSELDHALEMLFDPEGTGADYAGQLQYRFWETIEWGAVHRVYAKHYAETFAEEIGAPRCTFEELNSPREYNFTTDRIFCMFPRSFMEGLLSDAAIRARLVDVARDWFTSRSGFISHYSPDVSDWGESAEWDHNQFGALLQAAADVRLAEGAHFGTWEESALMERFRENGHFDSWIWDNTTDDAAMGNRCDRIARYLADRGQRAH